MANEPRAVATPLYGKLQPHWEHVAKNGKKEQQ